MGNKRILIAASLIVLGTGIFWGCKRHPAESPASPAVHIGYHCPMHPQYHSDRPGNCPICSMTLIPDTDSPQAQGASTVPGQGTVTVSPSQQQLVGVKVAPVESRDLFVSVRASARVAYDPALYSAILEHQATVEAARNSAGSAPFHTESEATVRASILRLRQMGLSEEQIKLVSQSGFDPSNLLLGKAGGTVWVYAEIYDYEASLVKPGQEVDLTSPSFPGKTIHGTVRAVDSIVNAETRTLRARIVTPNPDGSLKPDMYLNAAIHAALGRKLAVPEAAVIDTGTRQLVFVQTAPGQFDPRTIEIGRQAEGYFEVRSGLKEGEMVSTAANFLIDSESKLKAAVSGQ